MPTQANYERMKIYIPIWLDLLYCIINASAFSSFYLHSNMVRFIIETKYITHLKILNLHSNMVRFIIIG